MSLRSPLPLRLLASAGLLLSFASGADAQGRHAGTVIEPNSTQSTSYSVVYPKLQYLFPSDIPADIQGLTTANNDTNYWWLGWYRWFKPYFATSGIDGGGRLYQWNHWTRSWQLRGPTGFVSVPGVALSRWKYGMPPTPRKIYASVSTNSGPADRLAELDWWTGQGAQIGLFGSHAGRKIQDIEGLCFVGNILYGCTGFHYDGSPGDIFQIDPGTGRAIYLGELRHEYHGRPLYNELTGMSRASNGLVGSLGEGRQRHEGQIISIDLNNLSFHYIKPSFDQPGPLSDIAMDW